MQLRAAEAKLQDEIHSIKLQLKEWSRSSAALAGSNSSSSASGVRLQGASTSCAVGGATAAGGIAAAAGGSSKGNLGLQLLQQNARHQQQLQLGSSGGPSLGSRVQYYQQQQGASSRPGEATLVDITNSKSSSGAHNHGKDSGLAGYQCPGAPVGKKSAWVAPDDPRRGTSSSSTREVVHDDGSVLVVSEVCPGAPRPGQKSAPVGCWIFKPHG